MKGSGSNIVIIFIFSLRSSGGRKNYREGGQIIHSQLTFRLKRLGVVSMDQ